MGSSDLFGWLRFLQHYGLYIGYIYDIIKDMFYRKIKNPKNSKIYISTIHTTIKSLV